MSQNHNSSPFVTLYHTRLTNTNSIILMLWHLFVVLLLYLNLFLTAKLLKQGYRYHKIRKAFSKFYHRHSELIVKYNIGLKTLLFKAYQNLYFMVI